MFSDATKAVVLEALELLQQRAGHLEVVPGGLQHVPNLAKRATIDAAIAEVEGMAGWMPLPDGEYGGQDTITIDNDGGFVTIHSAYGVGVRKVTAMLPLPDHIRLCIRTGSQGGATDGK